MPHLLYQKETFKIIGVCMRVHRNLGPGFLESVYQEVLCKEFTEEGIPFEGQKLLPLYYKNQKLEKYFKADFLCFDRVILELKASTFIHKAMENQVVNYLKATSKPVGLLINFGEKSLTWKRLINTTTIRDNPDKSA
ncbi:GxxExxY protein [Leeuwenhoekiella parthenopeia]|uniref:GxxExxY protein n=1 Tax=Leeuwenhoekiella parthenopeia TaxID=2890320 RepID=A0ABS8GWC2_9FLAO|nr:GxxExxY protein [Leeuwenhoekiella parthenopeia]MCC4214257.1 GxxExxY protein [Leeuwenhoekiella parthenopeia]